MIAIVAGFFLVAYLLAPGAIYRVVFGLFTNSKRFQRSRTEEVVFSVFATALPFALTWFLLCHTPVGRLPELHGGASKEASYHSVVSALFSEPPHGDLVPAYLRAFKEQSRFVLVLWFLCAMEAGGVSFLLRGYGDLSEHNPLAYICEKLFLVHVSEWEWLFTTHFLPKSERNKVVEVDVLTSSDKLYRGRVTDWFVDADGKLLGLFLTRAERFRRDELQHDREEQELKPVEGYWKPIPGSNLYVQASSILNYNVRYVEDSDTVTTQTMGQKVRVTPLSENPISQDRSNYDPGL